MAVEAGSRAIGASATERLDRVLRASRGRFPSNSMSVGVQSEAVAVDAVVCVSNVRADWSGGRVVAMPGGRPGGEGQRVPREPTLAPTR
jgi:hypothetical protein